MKLAVRVTAPFEAPYRAGRCAVDIAPATDAARSTLVAGELEFGDIITDAAGTRSLSEFEVTLFEPSATGEGSRIRVRRWHSYEGATSTLRDVWLEARRAADGAIHLQKSSPAPLASLRAISRAWWMLDSKERGPSAE